MALLIAVFAFPKKADAASAITRMESGKTYSRKLDGKTHSVKYVYDGGDYSYGSKPTVKLYIDGALKNSLVMMSIIPPGWLKQIRKNIFVHP